MSPEHRALALFDAYVEMPPVVLAEAMAKLEREDHGAHAALTTLLNADAAAAGIGLLPFDTLLEASARIGAPDQEIYEHLPEGTRLGPWQIDEILGVGGMGAVYLAHRSDGHYEQQVAIKSIRAELNSPALIEAFRSERNLLAKLNHPDIVPILDGGVDDGGHPWFAMPLIHGQPVDQYCDEQRLTLRQRIQLFVQACDAVAYAHNHDVVHQDLKPSNLMISPDGRPKLLDFGLSTLLTDWPSGRKRIAISNGYAAPEALDNAPINVRQDIYSLGVLLYRLLCADLPYGDQSARHFTLGRSDAPLRAPSALAKRTASDAAKARRMHDGQALSKTLTGDLDAICQRCVASDPADRYPSVQELQADLRAWLQHRPISIRQGVRYRMGRYVRRNALMLAFGSVLLATLGAGIGTTLWQSHQAQQEAEAVQAINDLFGNALGSAAVSGLGETRLNSRQMLKTLEARLRAIPVEDNPLVRGYGLSSLAKSYAAIGDYPYATKLAREAQALGSNHPIQAARNTATLAMLLNMQSHFAQAERVARDGLKELGNGSLRAYTLARLQLEAELAKARWGQADHEAALKLVGDALIKVRALTPRENGMEAELLTLRGRWQTSLLNLEQAEADLVQAVKLAGEAYPDAADVARESLARALLARLKTDEALKVAETLVAHRRSTLGEDHPETGRALVILTQVQQTVGRTEESRASLREGEAIIRRTLGNDSPEMSSLLVALSAHTLTDPARYEEGIRQAREAVAIAERIFGSNHNSTLYAKLNLANKLAYVAPKDTPEGDRLFAESAELFRQCIAAADKNRLPAARIRLFYAMALTDRKRWVEAEQELKIAMPLIRKHYGTHHSFWGFANMKLAMVLVSQQRLPEAGRLLDALILDAKAPPVTNYSRAILIDAYSLKADIALSQKNRAAARDYWQKALADVRAVDPNLPIIKELEAKLRSLDGPA